MKIIGYLKDKHILKRYSVLFFALFLSSINYNLFLSPLKIVVGGVNGLSILLSEIVNISPSVLLFLLSITSFFIGLLILGLEKTASALVSTFVYPLFVSLTVNITDFIVLDASDMFLMAIIIGVLTGVVSGIICRVHMSQGGVILISQSIAQAFKVSVSRVNFIINTIIVMCGAFFFGFDMAMYAIIILYISSIVMNKIMLGVSLSKFIYIKTDKYEEVKNYVINSLKCGITELDGYSGNSGDKKHFLLTVVPTYEYQYVTEYVKKIDNNVFLVVTDAYQSSIK